MKNIFRSLIVLLYLGALVISAIILIKPGASIFYIQQPIIISKVAQDAGFANRYQLQIDPRIIRTQGILLSENGHPLNPSPDNVVVSVGKGAYSISVPSQGSVDVYFSSSDNSNLFINQRKYTLYLPLKFISPTVGLVALVILLPCTVWFLVFALVDSDHRRVITRSPVGIMKIINLFINHAGQRTLVFGQISWKLIKPRLAYWKRLFTITTLVAFFYIFMEWLFFVTMPSFMSMMGIFGKIRVFLLSGWGFALICISILAGFIIIDTLAILAHFSRVTLYIGLFIPSLILSSLILLLIDNFTYTLFKFGISNSSGVIRGVYALLFVLLLAYCYFWMLGIFGLRKAQTPNFRVMSRWFYVSLGFIAVSSVLAGISINYSNVLPTSSTTTSPRISNLPNILLLGSDGLNADHLSVYGYYRDTTPRIKELAQSSLVAENAFTNAGNTAGSVISIMTSKLPTQTRVLYPPDILTGLNSFQHLPGMLKNIGYKTIEFGVPYYIDAYSYNLQNGFDIVNNRTFSVGILGDIGRKLGFNDEVYFLSRVSWRISDRLLHIFFIRAMQNPFDIVTQTVAEIDDGSKINQVLSMIDQSQEPLFIHVHLLGTHGGYYAPNIQVFSKGEDQTQPWMNDFYDDTLLGFDKLVGAVIDHLKAVGKFDNTILILYTDHNKGFKVTDRIPLIIHFPEGSHAGGIVRNVENMDIAPTILDYLGISKPAWMEGESLLTNISSDPRLIFSTGTTKITPNQQNVENINPELNKPPFYQFSYINVLDCQRMYSFDLTTYQWSTEDVAGYVNPCNPADLHSAYEMKQAIYQRLALDGFDISTLPKLQP